MIWQSSVMQWFPEAVVRNETWFLRCIGSVLGAGQHDDIRSIAAKHECVSGVEAEAWVLNTHSHVGASCPSIDGHTLGFDCFLRYSATFPCQPVKRDLLR